MKRIFYTNAMFTLLLLAGILALPFMADQSMAGTIDLPKTGQTTCYDESGNVIDCAGTGQDGDILAGADWPDPRFTDNGDGTVTDNLTGLMWLKDGSALGRGTWQDSLNTVADFNSNPDNYYSQDYTANYTDWSIPNVNELESLVNAEETNTSTWLNEQGFIDVKVWGPSYWTSTTIAGNTNQAWYVIISGGNVINASKTHSRNIWAVRASQTGSSGKSNIWKTGQVISYADGDDGDLQRGISWPSPRFMDNEDGTVTDNLTGLMWLKDANSFGGKLWQDALDTVTDFNSNPDNYDSHNYTTYTDWRLSNRKELFSLIDRSQHYPALPAGHPFANVSFYYWSSTIFTSPTQLYQETRATVYPWYVRMDGYSNGEDGGLMPLPIWPVRDAGKTGTPETESNIEVSVDIKPQSCPNPLNTKSKGKLPVAILGTANFDVRTIDVDTIKLNGIAPVRISYEDVTTPAFKIEDCDCEALDPDSFEDLELKFDRQEIVNSLGDVNDGEVVILTLTGNLLESNGGTGIKGTDCVLIIDKGKK